MRIGFFTDYAYPGGFGVEFAINSFKDGLEKLGHEVFIYAPRDKEIKDENQKIFRFRSWKIQKNPKMFFNFPFLPVGRSWKEVVNFKLDIVHSQSPFNLGLLAKHIARRQRIPLIYTHHTDFPTWIRANMREKKILPYLARWWVKRYSNQTDAATAPSFKMKKILDNSGVKKPVYSLPNCINLNLFKPDKSRANEIKKQHGISGETKVLIFVGRLAREKNLVFLLKALKEILKIKKDVTLLLVGDGYQIDELKEVSKELGVDGNVRFTGFVSHELVPYYYGASDVFVMTSQSETMGLVVVEAEACGLPVVALDDLAFYDTVFEGENGFLVKEKEPTAFAARVLKLLGEPALYEKFSLKAREVAQRFSEEEQTKKLMEIYKNLS
jgi:glycosyltransferase involved in cell wall biosynthesis